MKHIQYLLSKTEIPSFTNDEIIAIISEENMLDGKEKTISICMEEFAELIEVMMEESITGKLDSIHLQEEFCDTVLCLEKLRTLYNISENDISNVCKYDNYYRSNVKENCILVLTQSIITLSKCIRNKPESSMYIINIINNIQEVLANIIRYYKFSSDNISQIMKIEYLKINRMKERNQKKLEELGCVDKVEILSTHATGATCARDDSNITIIS
jgi:hypothetical protein